MRSSLSIEIASVDRFENFSKRLPVYLFFRFLDESIYERTVCKIFDWCVEINGGSDPISGKVQENAANPAPSVNGLANRSYEYGFYVPEIDFAQTKG